MCVFILTGLSVFMSPILKVIINSGFSNSGKCLFKVLPLQKCEFKKKKYKTWICSNTTSSKRCGAAVTHKENLKPFFTIHCGQLTCMLCISYYLWFHPVFLHSSSPCLCCTESSSIWESPPSMECRYILKVPYCRYVELRTMSRIEFFLIHCWDKDTYCRF